MAELNRPRRPPPPAPMPRARTRPTPAAERRRIEIQPLPVDPLVEATRIPEWTPLPYPALMRDAPPEGGFDPFGQPSEPLISRRMAWSGMMTWCWGVVVLLLVVSPLAGVSKLVGPFDQPVSAGGYGMLIAPFGVIAMLIAGGAGIWLWLAMTQESRSAGDDPTIGL